MPAHKLTNQPDDGEHLICTACKVKKKYDCFYRAKPGTWHHKTYGGYCMACKDCKRAVLVNRETPEYVAERKRKYDAKRDSAEYVEHCRKLNRASYQRNRDKRLAYYKAQRDAMSAEEKEVFLIRNRSTISEEAKARQPALLKAWRATPEGRARHAASNRKRKDAKRTTEVKLTPDEWLACIEAYGRDCIYCEARCDNPSMDHVIPLSKCGEHAIHNVVPACLKCNSGKCDRDVEKFMSRSGLSYQSFLVRRVIGALKLLDSQPWAPTSPSRTSSPQSHHLQS